MGLDDEISEIVSRMGGGVVSSVAGSPAGDAVAFVWTAREFPMWYRLGILRRDGELVMTRPELRVWGRARWAPTGDLAVGGLDGIRRVVIGVDPDSAEDQLVASAPDASYELVEYLQAGVARCRRRNLDGSIDLVHHTSGGDAVIAIEQASAHGKVLGRLVTWVADGCRLEGMVIPPPVGDPPWEMVTFLHGGPVGALVMGEHERVGAWADPRRATFLPDFPASGICGEAAMLAAFEANELPEEDYEVDAVLSGADLLVGMGLADPDRLFLVGHSYGAYLVNRP